MALHLRSLVASAMTALQLAAIVRRRSARGVSIGAWLLFALANGSLYVYLGRWAEPQAILSTLATATLNLAIVAAALTIGRERPPAEPR